MIDIDNSGLRARLNLDDLDASIERVEVGVFLKGELASIANPKRVSFNKPVAEHTFADWIAVQHIASAICDVLNLGYGCDDIAHVLQGIDSLGFRVRLPEGSRLDYLSISCGKSHVVGSIHAIWMLNEQNTSDDRRYLRSFTSYDHPVNSFTERISVQDFQELMVVERDSYNAQAGDDPDHA